MNEEINYGFYQFENELDKSNQVHIFKGVIGKTCFTPENLSLCERMKIENPESTNRVPVYSEYNKDKACIIVENMELPKGRYSICKDCATALKNNGDGGKKVIKVESQG